MQRREQYLLGIFLTAIVAWQAGGWAISLVFGPFEERSRILNDLTKAVSEKSAKQLALVRAEKTLKEWKAKSLPPDDAGKSKQPTALDSSRSYLKWLTDLAQLCEFESLSVTPATGDKGVKDNVYIPVVVKIEAKARYDQLVRFLDLFYRTQLIHRISALSVIANVSEGDQILTVKLDAEGLVMIDAKPRRSLFPLTELSHELSDDATSLQVEDAEDFPKEANYRIRIKGEFLKVTEVDGKKWTVERGLEQTLPANYSSETQVELVKLDSDKSEQSLDKYRQMIATNIFAKPAPPYKLTLETLTDKSVSRGKTLEFSIATSGYDKVQGRPEFAVVGNPPAGLKLDRYGKVTWKPGDDVPLADYTVGFEVQHPSADNGRLANSFVVHLREPKPAPKLKSPKPVRVYLNREWTFRPELVTADSDVGTLTWTLGEKPPEGLTIDAKTGELKWSPGDTVPIGEVSVSLIVTDSDTPPQQTILSLPLNVQDDAAQFTRLTGILSFGDKKRAFLYDPLTEKRTELHEGDAFAIADLNGTVKQIGKNHVVMTFGQKDLLLSIGESLRQAQARIKDN